ncbi:MAG: sulfurtransferase [Isosphaeraceae bacterium]|nr:MAG: sulfurtransferase [Isosphaeraceae bacterium]
MAGILCLAAVWEAAVIVGLNPEAREDRAAGSHSTPATARLWSFEELKAHLGKPGLRILDARPKEAYQAGHLPGAVWVDVAAAEKLAATPAGLKDAEAWAAWAAPLGIGPETEVVVYDDQRQLAAARIWWLLTYLGVERAGLVDGGYTLWASQGLPVAMEATVVEPRPFQVRFQSQRLAERGEVLAALGKPGVQVLDARSPAEYAGVDRRSKRSGHIPSACNLEWKNLVGDDGRFVPLDQARDLLGAARLQPGGTVITHCQGGGRASVAAFVLERLGYAARNYYASWGDWGNAEDTPIEGETGPASERG